MASKSSFFSTAKPYIAMTSLQFGYAGMNIITKVSLNRGMSHFVLVVYRHAVATAVMAPFALVLERKVRPKMTFWAFCQIFALALLGPVIDQNLYYAGLKYTSPTFSCAISNLMPAMTFVMALLFRMEKLKMRQIRSQAKVVGTVICVGGAMLMTMYKGPIVPIFGHLTHTYAPANAPSSGAASNDKDWTKGSLMMIAACLAWAGFFVLQAAALKIYPAQLSLTTLICFVGTLQSIVLTLILERNKPAVWAVGWDMKLLTAVYSGVVASGIAYYVQGLCMQMKGPVFVTAFSPLMMIIVAIIGSIILSESIYLGSILGGILIVVGLYAVLWGKVKDKKLSATAEKELALPDFQKKLNGIEASSDIIQNIHSNPATENYQSSCAPHKLDSKECTIDVSYNEDPKKPNAVC